MRDGRPLAEDPVFALRMMETEIELEALRITNLRMLARAQAGGAPGAEASMLKIKGTEVRQALTDLTRRALGPMAAIVADDLPGNALPVPAEEARAAADYLNMRKISIFGGSNEIQKNILTKGLLG